MCGGPTQILSDCSPPSNTGKRGAAPLINNCCRSRNRRNDCVNHPFATGSHSVRYPDKAQGQSVVPHNLMYNLYSVTKGQAAIIAFKRAMRDRTGKLPDGYNMMLNIKRRIIIAMFCIFCSIVSVTAQRSAPEKPAERPLSEVLAPPDSMCINWTDDCRACARSNLGVITCSNVAAVCAAERIVRCLKRDDAKSSKE